MKMIFRGINASQACFPEPIRENEPNICIFYEISVFFMIASQFIVLKYVFLVGARMVTPFI